MKPSIFIFSLLLFYCLTVPASNKDVIVVAQDGSGIFQSIQEALNSIPDDNRENITILIKKGTYREKVFITKSFVTLVGEDRDSTHIVFAELREKWNALHGGVDWGAAVVNIDSTVTDILLVNLTIRNNYGSLYGSTHHQFAVRGGGTRIIILHCSIIADGGDTLSLWNRQEGMYYHADCYFEGWVDFVCPRGWCYITRSTFYGHNLSASIWHDGSLDKDQKFVIRDSFFDGVPGFPLGRNHRDGQFFLINCRFSSRMADRPIYRPDTSPTPHRWGARYYYYGCLRDSGDYRWFSDNLPQAEADLTADKITARWTFQDKWDPESSMVSIVPCAYFPLPAQDAQAVNPDGTTLRWTAGKDALRHRVHFGVTNPPGYKTDVTSDTIPISGISRGKKYFWRIDAVTKEGVIKGPVWSFTTR